MSLWRDARPSPYVGRGAAETPSDKVSPLRGPQREQQANSPRVGGVCLARQLFASLQLLCSWKQTASLTLFLDYEAAAALDDDDDCDKLKAPEQ